MKKVLFVATVVKKHINVFHLPFLKMFKEWGWETSVCARNDFETDEKCVIPYCDKYYDMPFERFPLKKENCTVYKNLKKLIESEKYDIIHCHTPVGGILARLAARSVRKYGTKVIYTAHGFHFFKGAPLINWLLYYPAEWMCSWFTDCLITINQEDYKLAKKMHAKKVEYVPGVGIDVDSINNIDVERANKLSEFGILDEQVLLSVGEINKNKNHRVIIKALGKVDVPFKYILCGIGDQQAELERLVNELNIEDRVIFAGYRYDVKELLKCADIFCFPSFREGLSLSLMEAISSGIPCVVSKIRGNTELVKDGINGFLCDPSDENEFAEAISKICKDRELKRQMSENAHDMIAPFDIKNVKKSMEKIYV